MEVLDNRQLYASILQGQGNYKTIGKPVSVLARANPESQEPVVREEADETVVPGPQPVPVVPFEEGN